MIEPPFILFQTHIYIYMLASITKPVQILAKVQSFQTIFSHPKMSIVAEAQGYLQVFSDGSVKRFVPETVAASADPSKEFNSKDIVVDPSKPVTARIFIPTAPTSPNSQLPVIVYFHGGGFCIGSTTWQGYHLFLGGLSVASQSVVFSVDYRLAPEHPLPAAYDDCYGSLEWLSRAADSEPWLQRADLSRVFLSGESAGGNIAHQVVVRAIRNEACGVGIKGLLSIHPFFGSEERTEREMDKESTKEVEMNDMFWGLSLPEGSSRDYYGCNFEAEAETAAGLGCDEWRRFPATAVYVAGKDFLKERGVMYAEFLRRKGVRVVRLVEAEGESHVYHLFRPESEATGLLLKQMTTFIHGC